MTGTNPMVMEANHQLARLARTTPYYQRNKARVCTFWQRGECTRGATCPYRHEEDQHDEALKNQNFKDRYFGNNDPVAAKMMGRTNLAPLLPPDDPSITTIYVGNLPDEYKEDDVKDHFYAYGEIKSIRLVPEKNCAFVTFATREAAEIAANKTHNRLNIKARQIRIDWARPAPCY